MYMGRKGTSFIRNRFFPGAYVYSRPMPRALGWSEGGRGGAQNVE